jgi:SAM-dependent methyltransferase
MSGHRYFDFDARDEEVERLGLRERIAQGVAAEYARVGLPPEAVPDGVEFETARTFARSAFDDLAAQGIDVAAKHVVDVGSGMGSVAVEAVARGAWPVAVEPGHGRRELAAARLREAGGGVAVAADAEKLPLADGSMDVAVSLQVLEHVVHPMAMLREVYRVLRPGGFFLLTCENYLSFREPHYRVAWLPLLPKRLGAAYLRLRGRPTEFLYDSVTYVTRPGVIGMLRECGFRLVRKDHFDALARDPSQIRSGWRRALVRLARRLVGAERVASLAFAAREVRYLCSGAIVELVRKPAQGPNGPPT